ncbi:pirin [Aquabacterium sp. NJ1]|uniref:pirin family protein n=1 Tax=Aquabacterium sp. NJ1 TaxID=1538295 RepID=UPI00052D96C7|nr:pirin family protein [Aquabacterium sp. NJ1]KGM42375.1 pirin [Aquabacterium sp. NJ1]
MDARLTLNGHVSDLGGGFVVRRLLPAARRQSVGPFIFFDHFGPLVQQPDAQTDVRPHPHIGLATVTYLFEGAMMHRDSLGSVQRIEPGAINWMTAGSGIVHSERTPDDLRHVTRPMHGLQLWVALPQALEEVSPSFTHTPADAIPEVRLPGCCVRVLVGQGWQVSSPVKAASPTLYLDVQLDAGCSLDLPALAPEMAVYTVAQALTLDGEALPAQTMAMLSGATRLANEGDAPARFVVIGGEPLDGPRFIWWNFVSSDKARITRAAQDWADARFANVPGETERIELPARRPW